METETIIEVLKLSGAVISGLCSLKIFDRLWDAYKARKIRRAKQKVWRMLQQAGGKISSTLDLACEHCGNTFIWEFGRVSYVDENICTIECNECGCTTREILIVEQAFLR